ncbi:hypothetical protein ACTHGU_20380 [Chitinophagaceae bacterium MMS25-I14]
MQTAKKLLIAFLGITAFMQIGLGAWILLGLNSLLENTHMTYSDDLKIFSTFFGVCLFIFASTGIVAISYNLKNKPEGLFLSKFVGWWMVIASCVVIAEVQRYDLAVVDAVRGILILTSAYMVKKN